MRYVYEIELKAPRHLRWWLSPRFYPKTANPKTIKIYQCRTGDAQHINISTHYVRLKITLPSDDLGSHCHLLLLPSLHPINPTVMHLQPVSLGGSRTVGWIPATQWQIVSTTACTTLPDSWSLLVERCFKGRWFWTNYTKYSCICVCVYVVCVCMVTWNNIKEHVCKSV